MLDETPLSPDWWLLRLGRRLRARQGQLNEWRNYFTGEPPLPVPPKGLRDQYRRFQEIARTNICGLIANSSVTRLAVTGIAGPDGEPDEAAWTWWKTNRLPARQKQVYRSALSQSVAYVVVGLHPQNPRRPLITRGTPSSSATPRPVRGSPRYARGTTTSRASAGPWCRPAIGLSDTRPRSLCRDGRAAVEA